MSVFALTDPSAADSFFRKARLGLPVDSTASIGPTLTEHKRISHACYGLAQPARCGGSTRTKPSLAELCMNAHILADTAQQLCASRAVLPTSWPGGQAARTSSDGTVIGARWMIGA